MASVSKFKDNFYECKYQELHGYVKKLNVSVHIYHIVTDVINVYEVVFNSILSLLKNQFIKKIIEKFLT